MKRRFFTARHDTSVQHFWGEIRALGKHVYYQKHRYIRYTIICNIVRLLEMKHLTYIFDENFLLIDICFCYWIFFTIMIRNISSVLFLFRGNDKDN